MNVKKIITLLLAALLVLSLAACGKQGSDDTTKPDGEPKNAQEAAAMYKDLMDQENAILTENQSLWEKVFQSADKGMTTQEDGKNYGDFLLDTIESAKDKFTADELKLLRQGGEKIREIERTLAAIEAKFPDAAPKAPDNGDSIPADSPTTPGDSGKTQKFPAFEGKDLNGNTVKSDDLFSKNAVTVMNFWFTTCNPCVGELAELDALNKELAGKGAQKGEIASKVKVPPFVAGKLMAQARAFTREQILSYVEFCVESEEAVKTGRLSDRLAVELLIAKKYE